MHQVEQGTQKGLVGQPLGLVGNGNPDPDNKHNTPSQKRNPLMYQGIIDFV